MGRIPGGYVTNHVYTWVDPQGRSISPPPDLLEQHTASGRLFNSQHRGHAPQQGAERRVSVWVTAYLLLYMPHQSLDMMNDEDNYLVVLECEKKIL